MRTVEDHSAHDPARSRQLLEETEADLRAKDVPAALARLEKAAKANPRDGEIPLVAAMLYFRQGFFDRAARLVLSSLEIRPFNPTAMNFLGVICLEAGSTRLAERTLLRAARMAPGLPIALRNLEDARRAARDEKRNRRRDAADETPEGFPVAEIRSLLERGGNSVTACILARGDVESLPECLDALEGVADEIVVIDASPGGMAPFYAGTRDVRCVRFDWQDDAAAARNEAIRLASGDWILSLDARERLDPGQTDGVAAALAREGALDHALLIHDPGTPYPLLSIRLFRNAPEVRFSGRNRDRLLPSLAPLRKIWGLAGEATRLRLARLASPDPYGVLSGDAAKEKIRIERDLEAAPGDAGALLRLAELHLETGDPVAALSAVRRAARFAADEGAEGSGAAVEEIVTLEGRCLMRLGCFEELGDLLRRHHEAARPTHNTLFLEGMARLAVGGKEEAAALFQRALSCAETSPSYVPPLPEAEGAGLPIMLGAALLELKRFPEAHDAFQAALLCEPESLQANLGLLAVLAGEDRPRELLEGLDRLANDRGYEPRTWLYGEALLSCVPGLSGVAADWMEEAAKRLPADEQVARRLGDALLRTGRGEEALLAWERLEDRAPSDVAGRVAASLLAGRALPAVPADRRDEVAGAILGTFESWRSRQALAPLDRALMDILRADAAVPGLASKTANWLERVGQREASERVRRAVGN